MSRHSSYIICGTPRSGSTMLCRLLENCGCGRPESYFRRQSIRGIAEDLGVTRHGDDEPVDFSRRYLAAVIEEGRADTDIFGLRVMFETLPELSERLETLFPEFSDAPARFERAFGRPLYIHLSRGDKVAQAVSLYKALRTGLWHRAADGSEMERTAPHQDAEYDAEKIGATVAELSAHDDGWQEWFAAHGITPLRLRYEELSLDPRSGLRTVLAALGRDASLADHIAPSTARLFDEESARWVARFREERAQQ
jgi:LPS sulfotransferase NodH